jgi:hypothetical protein
MVEEHQRNASARRSEERLYALRKKGLSDGEIAAKLERVRRVIDRGPRK